MCLFARLCDNVTIQITNRKANFVLRVNEAGALLSPCSSQLCFVVSTMEQSADATTTSVADPASINEFHQVGAVRRSLLMLVSGAGNLAYVEELLRNGADANLRSPDDGKTALHLAIEGCSENMLEIIKALIAAGANRSIADDSGKRAIDLLQEVLERQQSTGDASEQVCARYNIVECIMLYAVTAFGC